MVFLSVPFLLDKDLQKAAFPRGRMLGKVWQQERETGQMHCLCSLEAERKQEVGPSY